MLAPAKDDFYSSSWAHFVQSLQFAPAGVFLFAGHEWGVFLPALGKGEAADGGKGIEGRGMPKALPVSSLGSVWV